MRKCVILMHDKPIVDFERLFPFLNTGWKTAMWNIITTKHRSRSISFKCDAERQLGIWRPSRKMAVLVSKSFAPQLEKSSYAYEYTPPPGAESRTQNINYSTYKPFRYEFESWNLPLSGPLFATCRFHTDGDAAGPVTPRGDCDWFRNPSSPGPGRSDSWAGLLSDPSGWYRPDTDSRQTAPLWAAAGTGHVDGPATWASRWDEEEWGRWLGVEGLIALCRAAPTPPTASRGGSHPRNTTREPLWASEVRDSGRGPMPLSLVLCSVKGLRPRWPNRITWETMRRPETIWTVHLYLPLALPPSVTIVPIGYYFTISNKYVNAELTGVWTEHHWLGGDSAPSKSPNQNGRRTILVREHFKALNNTYQNVLFVLIGTSCSLEDVCSRRCSIQDVVSTRRCLTFVR